MKKYSFLALFVFARIFAFCQEKEVILFEYGKSDIRKAQKEILINLPLKYDLDDVDSVSYVGFADSIGSVEGNKKLAEARAEKVAGFCVKDILPNTPFSIVSKGKVEKNVDSMDRRVEILLYLRPDTEKVVKWVDSGGDCYNIEYDLLKNCHITDVIQKKKEFVDIELQNNSYSTTRRRRRERIYLNNTSLSYRQNNRSTPLYYGETGENGKFIIHKTYWHRRVSGKLWWRRERFYVRILKSDFDKYKIFRIGKKPCDSCSQDFAKGSKLKYYDTSLFIDEFLMSNIQYRFRFFNFKNVKVRVPREYVNPNLAYYASGKIHWDTKKGKKKSQYYYCKLPLFRYYRGVYPSAIWRYMAYCGYRDTGRGNFNDYSPGGGILPINTFFELGNRTQKANTQYMNVGLSAIGNYERLDVYTGVNRDLSFNAGARYQYYFFSFPLYGLSPLSVWTGASAFSNSGVYFKTYIGSDIRYNSITGTVQNFHLGVSLGLPDPYTSPDLKFFIQGGLETNYLHTFPGIYPVLQFGLIWDFYRFYYISGPRRKHTSARFL